MNAPITDPLFQRRPQWLIWAGGAIVAGCVAALVYDPEVVEILKRNRYLLLRGAMNSWLYALASIFAGLVVGICLAAIRTYGGVLAKYSAGALVETVRGTPQLVVILWVYFVLPEVTKIIISPEWTAFIALTLIASVYLAEVVRAGLSSVSSVQSESAFVTGLTRTQSFLFVVLPQALSNMIPALIATFVMLFKTTTLLHVIGIQEFFHATYIVNSRELFPYTMYAVLAAYYLTCCLVISAAVNAIDPKYTLQN